MRICLAGNPNSGKTTIFNALTGSRQRVGNWAGVTVDKKQGTFTHQGQSYEVTDLPGTYSLSVVSEESSLDERIACEHLLSGDADLVINIIDASNLERNLYLSAQLLEMKVPMILAVNMTDIAAKRGLSIDLDALRHMTGCPSVALIGRKKRSVQTLKKYIVQQSQNIQPRSPYYDVSLEQPITNLLPLITQAQQQAQQPMKGVSENADPRWLAIRLLENDMFAKNLCQSNALCQHVARQQAQIEANTGEDCELLLADQRYQWANKVVAQCTQRQKLVRDTLTEWFDHIAMNRWLGIPVFLLVMYAMFEFSINLGSALQPIFDDGSRTIFIDGMMYLGSVAHLPLWLTAILAQGVGLGINTVITFVPQIGCMFLFLAFLEDSGYMARAAFVMDKLMQWVGLPGKSFVPLIVGFGCNVPSIMATRTLESRRDRLLTIMMSPFMSCGARLAIFAVFAAAFFPKGGAGIVFLLYMTGIVVAIITGLVVKKLLLPGKPAPFIMEMPPYHLPSGRTIVLSAWQRLKRFLFRAGKVIVPICVLVGTLNTVQLNGSINPNGSDTSLLSYVGRAVTPALAPMGVQPDNWPATVGLATGFLAKEVVVGTLNTLYTQNDDQNSFDPKQYNLMAGLKAAVQNTYDSLTGMGQGLSNPLAANEAEHNMTRTAMGTMVNAFGSTLSAFAYMLFILLYIPCVSTIAVTTREASRGWAILSLIWSMVVAYALAVIVYQVGSILSHPFNSTLWIASMLVLLGITLWGIYRKGSTLSLPAQVLPNHPAGGCH